MLVIRDILDQAALAEIRSRLPTLSLVDGAATAGEAAREVKRNQQAASQQPEAEQVVDIVLRALTQSRAFNAFAIPARFSRIILSRYGPGDGYGPHVDNAFTAGQPPVRTDLSFTIFLSDPESYEGGALNVDQSGGGRSIKLPAGGIIVYDTRAVHRVEPVTRGERWAAVGWVQSVIRSPEKREVIADLNRLWLEAEGEGKLLLHKILNNLLRMWAE